MKKTSIFWILAFILTAGSALFQYVTGPSYPLRGTAIVTGRTITYKLDRSHGGLTDCPVKITTNDKSVGGTLEWRRYKTNDAWGAITMQYDAGVLSAELPYQPPAGKLEYRVLLNGNGEEHIVPEGSSVIVRFRGDVPWYILVPHILAMFGGMFFSARTGLEALQQKSNLRPLMLWTIVLLFAGGFILGPLVQWHAFGAFWTGWPVGTDLTDNKTAVAVIAWLFALVMLKRSAKPAWWAIGAASVTLAVYLIPHSVLGSEIDYNKIDQQKPSSYHLMR